MMEGWIKLYPKIIDWRWYRDTYAKSIFLHLLLTANYKDTPFLDMEVKRGQVLTSIRRLSEDLDIPEKTVRRKLGNLKSSGEIVTESTNRWTIITICNYESYQGSAKTDDQADDQTNDQTDDQHNKNNRNIINPLINKETISKDIVKKETPPTAPSLETRQKSFYDSLIPFVDQYGKETVRDFYDYWSEPDRAKAPKMRFEKQPTWCLKQRLARWSRNQKPQQSLQAKPSKLDQYKQVAIQLGLYHDGEEQSDSIDEQ